MTRLLSMEAARHAALLAQRDASAASHALVLRGIAEVAFSPDMRAAAAATVAAYDEAVTRGHRPAEAIAQAIAATSRQLTALEARAPLTITCTRCGRDYAPNGSGHLRHRDQCHPSAQASA